MPVLEVLQDESLQVDKLIVADNARGDNLDRFLVRLGEIRQSARIILQCCDRMADDGMPEREALPDEEVGVVESHEMVTAPVTAEMAAAKVTAPAR